MFFQPPDEEPNNNSKSSQNHPRSRRQKKLRRKNRQKAIKKDQLLKKTSRSRIPITMSSWAENFTTAATWQLKHQIAFWKSKATSLEYENKLLHDIIRKNYINTQQSSQNETIMNSDEEDVEEDCIESENEPDEYGEGELEVSEEFIQFLRDNKKYRDDAKRERERLKDLHNTERRIIEEMEAGPSENAEDPQELMKRLYGDNWERISALETSLQSQFINICDREKPMYWPNIPFNFNFG